MAFISEFNSLMWGYVLSIILLGKGLVYSIATGFPQLTQFGKIWDSLKANMNGEGGISGFSALCATVGGFGCGSQPFLVWSSPLLKPFWGSFTMKKVPMGTFTAVHLTT